MIPPMARIDMPKEPVAAFCRKYGVRRLALFGSVLTDAKLSGEFRDLLSTHRSTYDELLAEHFGRHLEALRSGM